MEQPDITYEEPSEGKDLTEAEPDKKGISYEENLTRFKAKIALFPAEYHAALGWLYVNRQIQDERKRLGNRATQMTNDPKKRIFWGRVLPDETKLPMHATLVAASKAIEKSEAEAARGINANFKHTSWYREVAIPAARGVGISESAGTLSAIKIFWTIGSPSRFKSFAALIRYARLAPENGKAPRRRAGTKIHYNPACWQALYDLSESWLRQPESSWREEWDNYKVAIGMQHPDYPKGRVHNMARRKILRTFLRDLWDLWLEWENARK